MELNHSFWLFYAALAFCGMGFAMWAGYEWYMISKRCQVLERALERERNRRTPGEEAEER